MNIPFVTGIFAYEKEDRVIEILTSHGFELRYRALSLESLWSYLDVEKRDKRCVAILDEEIDRRSIPTQFLQDKELAFVVLTPALLKSEELLIKAVEDSLRRPEIILNSRSFVTPNSQWVSVTGASGSPGVSTVALNLASEISHNRSITLIDADSRHSDLHVLLGTKREGKTALNPQLSFMGIVTESDRDEVQELASKALVVDLGEMASLHDNFTTDRRRSALNQLEFLFRSSIIVFVLQPDNRSLLELESFLSFANRELSNQKIVFVLNKMGKSTRQRALLKSFRNRTAEQATFVIPNDDPLLDRAKSRFAVLSEVGARSHVRKALLEVSIYLDNSF